MIKVLYPPGCYGNYIARCLYNYTNMRLGEYKPFMFDSNGSSHIHRSNQHARSNIGYGHPGQLLIDPEDQVITILTDKDHFLDYYDNQFHKQQKGHVLNYIKNHFTVEELTFKLTNYWNYTQPFDELIPTWILREFCSFWIQDCLNNAYTVKQHQGISINTQDMFSNFINSFDHLCWVLDLNINIEPDLIKEDNKNFCNLQHYHNIQLKCQCWTESCLTSDQSLSSPCKTIFDEAYVQYLLRQRGYEIQCDGLNTFPTTSDKMKLIIYKQ